MRLGRIILFSKNYSRVPQRSFTPNKSAPLVRQLSRWCATTPPTTEKPLQRELEQEELEQEHQTSLQRELEQEKIYVLRATQQALKSKERLMDIGLPSKWHLIFSLGVTMRTKGQIRNVSADFLFNRIQEHVDLHIDSFRRVCNFEKDLPTWFALTCLHVWMVIVRLRYEGKEGKKMQYSMFSRFWQKFDQKLEEAVQHPILVARYKKDGISRYQGLFVALDNAILSGDTVMVNTLHRNFFSYGAGVNAQNTELMIQYIHRTLYLLDHNSSEAVVNGVISFGRFPKWMSAPPSMPVPEIFQAAAHNPTESQSLSSPYQIAAANRLERE